MEKESLKMNYVGKNYEKLYNKNFSIWAFIFGWCYFIYRKMILVGFGFLFLQNAILSFFGILDKPIVIIAYLLINLSLSLLFNSMYRKHVDKKVNIIIASSQNEEEAMKKCIKKGGTSVSWVIVSIIITIIFMIIFTLIYGAIFVVNSAVDFVKDTVSAGEESFQDNTITILEGGGYSAIGGTEDLSKYLTYKLDEKFEQDDMFEDTYIYEDADSVFDEVSFKIRGYENIVISEEAKNGLKEEKLTVNDKEWTIYKYNEEDENEDMVILATIKVKDINAFIRYTIEENANREEALEEFNNILESIQYK